MNWSRWNWLRDIALPVAFSLLQASWLWLWLELARRWAVPSQQRVLMPLPVMMGLVLGAMALGRRALAHGQSLNRARLTVAGAGLSAIVVVLWWRFYWPRYWIWDLQWLAIMGWDLTHWGTELPGPVVVLVAASHLWLQGLQNAYKALNIDDACATFVGSLVGLALGLLAAGLDGRGMPPGTMSVVVLCFAAGMAALASSNLELWRGADREADESHLSVNRYWLGSVVVVIAGLLAAGLLLSLLIAPESLAGVLRWASAILSILGRLAAFVLVAAAYLIFLVLTPLINWLSAWLRSLSQSIEPPEQLEVPNFQEQLEELQRNAHTTAGSEALRWLGLAAVAAIITLAFILAVRRLETRRQEDVEETRESVFSRDLLRQQLAALWREWLGRLREAPRAALSPFLSLEGEASTRRMVRAMYQALLATAAAKGRPRLRGQTPAEYQLSLAEAELGADDALRTITGGYELARYAPEPPTLEQAEEACQAWEQIKAALEDAGSSAQG